MKVFVRDSAQRALALGTETHVLIFRHSPSQVSSKQASTTSLPEGVAPRCIVEFSQWETVDMKDYRSLPSLEVKGTLGLVTIKSDVFLCVVNDSRKVATVRPGEAIQQILGVEFHCLTSTSYDALLNNQINPFPTDDLEPDGFQHSNANEPLNEHPCMALKKLLSGGSFYYSADFDLTKRLQDRPADASTVAIDSLDAGFLWNSYMIQPLVEFRSRLSEREKVALDQSRILTSAIRGFAATVPVPASFSPARATNSGLPSSMTLISRLSSRRAGTRFNARGIDDDGNVANFVETETVFCTDLLCFAYVQCRGSVPLFWEQQVGLPTQQKIQVTRSPEATKPAFDKHFEGLAKAYGDVFVVNLLAEDKSSEAQLTALYEAQLRDSALNAPMEKSGSSGHRHLNALNYDFHAETKGPNGFEAAAGIKRYILDSAIAFEYFLAEDTQEVVTKNGRKETIYGQNDVLKQAGVFRTNCLDCLDRTNLIQTIISQMVLEIFIAQQSEKSPPSTFWATHGALWADCGDALSKIYTGTGALKSSFTRAGKGTLAGMFADFRKSAHRLYVNNFEDKGRQETIDLLLGRAFGQLHVLLYDPVNDWVTAETARRTAEYTTPEQISIWIGTFNLNGKTASSEDDLSLWLCQKLEKQTELPEIYAVAFQEIVELDVQQIMSTDPHRRQVWEDAVRETLNANAYRHGSESYVLLRGGQLVGASLSIFVKASALPYVKNVEGAVKKTGMSGMAGNKGAVAIRMEYADTSICLVTSHLAAGFANYEERNEDYRTISNGLRFQRGRSIEDHKTIFWFGDFNYRIGMTNEKARELILRGDLGTLYENDQLNIQMVHGKTFPYYSETPPKFLPTYKFNIGTDEYDTSEKSRIPAWCDRILTRGDNLRQLHYDSAPLRFSDHRPVWGLFQCTISVVDQAKKDLISNELYTKRRAAVGNHTANASGDSDDESLFGYESIEPGLPPASSDKRKWWLDNGMPARSTVTPPTANHVPNPVRQSNPFSQSPDSDWIKVDRPDQPSLARTSSQRTTGSTAPQASRVASNVVPRKLVAPPPSRAEEATQENPSQRTSLDGATTDGRVRLKETLRKPAPPKPSKPTLLRGQSSQSVTSARSVPPPPEPRRANNAPSAVPSASTVPIASQKPGAGPMPPPPRKQTGSVAKTSDGPPLPPRKAATGLMDQGGGEELEGWEPLKPQ